MPVREDLIASAVSFLQDPSIASSPPDKLVAFLRSKNLTSEEVDVALARAGVGSSATSPISYTQGGGNASSSLPPPPSRPPIGNSQYGYGNGYPGYGQWMPGSTAQTVNPQRDWRDWFIMATVTGGVGYGLYAAAQRYILPLISPPTPPQLQSDKDSIDASFNRAFALIDQLTSDTAALQAAEVQRTEKLDSTINDIETVVAELKAANTRRENEARVLAEQVNGMKEMVPKCLEEWKKGGDGRLEEIAGEVSSLKRLVENRVGLAGPGAGRSGTPVQISNGGSGGTPATLSSTGQVNGSDDAVPSAANGASENNVSSEAGPPSTSSSSSSTGGLSGRRSGQKAAIPAWQKAAASNSSSKGGGDEMNGS